jgi:hypothetical protein
VLSSHYVAASERLRQSEVEHFTGAIGAELDVRGFEITVDNALLVRGLEASGDLRRDRRCLIHKNRRLLDSIRPA